jgi:hypothetical protein
VKGYINDPKKTRNRHSAKTLTTPCKLKAQGSPCPNCGTAVKFYSYGDRIVTAKEHSDMAEEKSPSRFRNF